MQGVGDAPPSTTPETVEHPSESNPGWEQPPRQAEDAAEGVGCADHFERTQVG